MHLWLVVILGIAGALAGHYFADGRVGRGGLSATAYGALAGIVVALVLPVLLGLVGLLFRLVFTLGVIVAVVFAVAVVWRLARRR